MIFEELTLHNFGAFRARQTMKLAPPAPERPVVLVGGLNGCGKTTLLEAVQLLLFGKRSRSFSRSGQAWEEYLRKLIHRGSPATDGAALELQFSRWEQGRLERYRVHRSWTGTAKGVRERLELFRNDKPDRALAENWDSFVEGLLPLGISDLFFFDGEQIADFANFERTRDILQTALSSLLGVELIDRLGVDITVLKRRKASNLEQHTQTRLAIEKIESEIATLESRRAELDQDRAALQNRIEFTGNKLKEQHERFVREGGHLFLKLDELTARKSAVAEGLTTAAKDAREVASGALPLLLVREQLAEIEKLDRIELDGEAARMLAGVLKERDHELLQTLIKLGVTKKILRQINDELETDRSKRSLHGEGRPILSFSSEGRQALAQLSGFELHAAWKEAAALCEKIDELTGELLDLDRTLQAVPDATHVATLRDSIDKLNLQLDESRRHAIEIDEERARITREIEKAQRRGDELRHVGLEHEDDQRLVTHIDRVASTLSTFRRALIERHASKVAGVVLETARLLFRKKDLVSRLTIDPESLALNLFDRNGHSLPPERLSAGERQILAIGLLWGLARASEQSFPTMIDTPLGRLDSKHRSNLVEHYVPYVSHQTILLSTDEEITPHHHERLSKYVGRCYRLEHDETTSSTSMTEGYFGVDHVA